MRGAPGDRLYQRPRLQVGQIDAATPAGATGGRTRLSVEPNRPESLAAYAAKSLSRRHLAHIVTSAAGGKDLIEMPCTINLLMISIRWRKSISSWVGASAWNQVGETGDLEAKLLNSSNNFL